MTITKVPLTGQLKTPTGEPAAKARLVLEPNAAIVDPGTLLVLPERFTVTADDNGNLPAGDDLVELFACDDPGVLPSGLAYRVLVTYLTAERVELTLFVPHTADSVDIADAVPGPPPASSVPLATAAALAEEAADRITGDAAKLNLTGGVLTGPLEAPAITQAGEPVVDESDERLDDQREPTDSSVTTKKLAPDVAAQLSAGGYVAKRLLGDPVEAVDPANPQTASDLSVVTVASAADLVVMVTGTLTPDAAGIPGEVRLIENGTLLESRSLRSPWDGDTLPVVIRVDRPGPVVIGSEGYLAVDGGYGWTGGLSEVLDDDLRARILVAPDVWAPGAPGVLQTLFSQWDDLVAGVPQHGLLVRLDEAGDVFFQITSTGNNPLLNVTLDLPPQVDGERIWIEVARRASTGLTTLSVSGDGTTWVLVASGVLSPGLAPWPSTAPFELGGYKGKPSSGAPLSPLHGKIYAFELATAHADGDWTVVADPDFRTATSAGPLTDSHGKTWKVVNT